MVRKITEGDFSQEKLVLDSKDEFGCLARDIESMRISLRSTLEELKEEVEERKQMENELLLARKHMEELVKERTAELQMANQVLIFENAEYKKAREQLNMQYAVECTLITHAGYLEVFPQILQCIGANLRCDFGEIWLIDEETNLLRNAAIWYGLVNNFPKFGAVTPELTFSIGVGFPGRIWAAREAIWIPDVVFDTNFSRAQLAIEEGLRGGFGFPVQAGDEILGVIDFFTADVRQPDYTLLGIFTVLGNQIGQFIDRKRREERINKLNQELELRVIERTSKLQLANEKLKNTQAQLVQSSKMASLGQLAGGVAHEINNPLTGVLNNIQLIKMELAAKKDFNCNDFRNNLDIIEESAQRCASIVHSLLDFSHSAKGAFTPLSLNDIAEKIIVLIGQELRLYNIVIEKQFQEELPLVLGDSQLLQQVLFDIVSNAQWAIRKKSGQGGVITMKTEYEPGKTIVFLSISDTGIGISQENLEKLFEPFFTTKPIGEGTGLGLAIVYSIIKKHNGDIEVVSEFGQGTTFKISLPVLKKKDV